MRNIFISIVLFNSFFCHSQMLAPKRTESEKVTFYGLTSLNSSNDNLVENITASGRLAVEIVPVKNNRLKFNIGANLLNANPSKGIKKDSVDFNSLMFPESGNFGFLFNPSYKILPLKCAGSSEHSLFIDATYSYRKVSIDSPNVSFKINSINAGLKYMWEYNKGDADKNLVFTLMGYWNLFNVPDEDVKKFNSIMSDSLFSKVSRNAEIYSIGLKTTIQYKQFLFFADLRRNIKTKELSDDNPFKGTKFNIGFATSIKLKSF